ncbi:four-carbon acid sugar kinase family protein [Ensifer sp. HO-A22]|uniref:Four-carbon acid sugar kinase family protein n=1 Tax=Ensifer oleiphilus TaxID=2742698 RepID=A0A7Y6URQ4_9HYPH|nr:four-carbon acid sugar kinase family protein [Ensifer oleiphilus]NVD43068.1 four-carbon acid sugar kinase family protein [Ensifer oleiphilus]
MLAIVADDLTGALDAAAPFASRGLHTEIALTIGAIPATLSEHPQVISINVASRELDITGAQDATAAALAALPPGTRLFKKIDSRLKGHIEAELDVTPFRSALIAPAIPDFGRIVKEGRVQGFGVDTPISISETLGRHLGKITVPDVATSEEMSGCLHTSQERGVDVLIGARGLAEALARQMTGGANSLAAEIPRGPGLFVIGSRDPITLAQIEELRATRKPRYMPAPNGRLTGAIADESLITLVQAVPGSVPTSSKEVSRLLAESVFPALTRIASTLLLSGGATAEAVLEKMGITRFRLVGECMPGLGLAHADGRCIIAKSGGFGQPGTLRELADRILRSMG